MRRPGSSGCACSPSGYLRYVEAANFPGGCFFASIAAEMDTHPGPVRDIAVGFMADWLALLEQTIGEAQAEGDIDPEVEPAQLAFEIEAHLLLSNALFAISARADADRARAPGARAPLRRSRDRRGLTGFDRRGLRLSP